MPTYEIQRRDSHEHRAGHFTFAIDGVESEYTCDPAQWMPSALKAAAAAGTPADQVASFVDDYCQRRGQRVMERVIQRIKDGKRIVGGIAIGADGLAPDFGAKQPRLPEKEAVDRFLNRGLLKGMSVDDRKARRAKRNERKDHVAEWQANRAALIAQRQRDLAEARAKLPHPKAQRLVANLERELAGLGAKVLAATHGFQYAMGQFLSAGIDLPNDDIRSVPLMNLTTADTERDAVDTVSDFSTLDEFDGSGYSTGGQPLDNQAVNVDDANDRAEFDADDEAGTFGAGTRPIQGNLLIKWVTNLNSSLPIHWLEYAVDKNPDGSLFTVIWDSEGILQLS